VEESNSLLAIDLMNPDLPAREGRDPLPKGTLHIFRAKVLWQGACHEHIRITHHGSEHTTVRLEFGFAGDFVDLFEVRGMKRERRGERLPPEVMRNEVALPYQGLDGVARRTRLHFDPAPTSIDTGRAAFDVHLEPGSEHHL
jgi:glycogen debranching enzyme